MMAIPSKSKQFDLLCDTLEKVSRQRGFDGRIRIIMEAIATLGSSASCRSRYAQYIEEQNALAVRCATGDYGRFNPNDIVYRAEPSSSLTGWVFTHKEPLCVNSFDKDVPPLEWKGKYRSTSGQRLRPIRSFVAVPVQVEGRVIGVLSIDAEQENFFDESQMQTFRPYFLLLVIVMTTGEGPLHEPVMDSVNRYRRRQVLVLGKDTEPELKRLRAIAIILSKMDYQPLLVKEHPDIPELSNEEKVRVIADLSRFVILENSFPAGQIAECKMCATNRIITASMRERGRGSSFMVTDYFNDFDFMHEFEYTMSPDTLKHALGEATAWAEAKIRERREYYDNLYPWRKKKDPD